MIIMGGILKNCGEIFLLLFLLSWAISELNSQSNLCPESSVCECKKGWKISIACDAIDSLRDVQILLERFQNQAIGQLWLKKHCTIKNIPSKAFQNSTITNIFFECPFQNISDDCFEGVKDLLLVTLQNTSFTHLPKGIESSKGIQFLTMWDGDLTTLKNELRNLTAITMLSLRNNAITSISDDAFITLVNLRHLDLSCNYLTVLNPNLLDTITFLQNVNISLNHLSSIGDLLNKKKHKLNVLDIHGNNLTNVDILFDIDMLRMKELYIGENPLSSFTQGKCGGNFNVLRILDAHKTNITNPDPEFLKCFPEVEQLFLSDNNMLNISPEVFRSFSTLLVLRLDNNRLQSIDGVFANSMPRLNELYLNNNDIEVLGEALRSRLRLEILDLKHNKIRYILKSDFYNLGSLKRLDLSHNKILWMSSGSFFGVSSLEVLFLTSNNISSINGSLQHLPYLTEIFLSHNNMQAIGSSELVGLPNLQNCFLSHNQIKSLVGSFVSLPRITRVLLDNNRLETLSEDTFANVTILQQVSLQDNQWNCDCRLIWLRNWLLSRANSTGLDDTPKCHLPKRFQDKPITSLTDEDLIEWREDCPDSCRCECIAEGRNFYVSVNCSYRGLNNTPEVFPDHTRELNLKGNQLRNIDNLQSFDSLTLLNLEENAIDNFPVFLPETLSILLMAQNNMTRFNTTAVGNLSLQEATMSKNPWICDCETLDFKNWLSSQSLVVSDVNETLCGPKQANTYLSNKPIVHLSQDELCPSELYVDFDFTKVILSLVVVTAFLVFVYIRYNMQIKIWMYAHGFSFVKEEDLDKDKEFDAFVSYSSYDEEFFTIFKEELQKREPEMFLCSSENFMFGSLIIENITKAIKASKRTILILSGNFLMSEWCKVEFRVAQQQALDDKIHRLIIMKYGEISPDIEVDPTLQEFLDTTTYLNWGEKYFWDKLFYALPKKKKKRGKGATGSANGTRRAPVLTG